MNLIIHVIKDVVSENFLVLKNTYGFDFSRDDIEIDIPRKEEYGDFSTPVALKTATRIKKNPMQLGEELLHLLQNKKYPYFEKIELFKPGFINFFISKKYLLDNLDVIRQTGEKYGQTKRENPEKIIIEFVSANPTGPLNVVSARAATVGDVLTKLLEMNGNEVYKEYYINNAGRQVQLLAESVHIRIQQHLGQSAQLTEEHYQGEYLLDIAREIAESGYYDKIRTNPDMLNLIRDFALNKLIDSQKKVLDNYNVRFDNWFKEDELRKSNEVDECYKLFQEKGLLYEEEGKIFFKSTLFNDEKDRVIIRQDKTPTYFYIDIVYHLNKIRRGFTEIIDLWGPDHDGYIPRLKGALKALDFDEQFKIIIIQQINLIEKEKKVQMSKRLGTFVKMQDLIDDIGVDAARFFFLHRNISSHLDFDMDLARKHTDDNPVYYVQYAYARICNIFIQAEKNNVSFRKQHYYDPDLLTAEEIKLMKKLLEYPVIVHQAAAKYQPNLITAYLLDLSAVFHQFYTENRVLNEEDKVTQSRLFLSDCARLVLHNGLNLIGVSSPERM